MGHPVRSLDKQFPAAARLASPQGANPAGFRRSHIKKCPDLPNLPSDVLQMFGVGD
jgi:hypothetical protein